MRDLGLGKGDKIAVTPRKMDAPGMTYGERYELACLGWIGGVPEFERVDNGAVVPWVAFSSGFLGLVDESRTVVSESSRRLTYLGRRAVVLTQHHDKGRNGLRTVETTWIDDASPENGGYSAGTVVRSVIRGDGRTADFEVVEPEEIIGHVDV
jgi:hypothetical protein